MSILVATCIVCRASGTLPRINAGFSSNAGRLRNAEVLELGSGTGVVGIVAALMGAHVTLTDVPGAVPALISNIDRNREAIEAAGGTAVGKSWDWTTSFESYPLPTHSDGSHANGGGVPESASSSFILGSDLVYAPRQSAPLAKALKSAATSRPGSVILLAHKHRSEETDLALLGSLISAGLTVEKEPSVQMMASVEGDSGSQIAGNMTPLQRVLEKNPNISVYRLLSIECNHDH